MRAAVTIVLLVNCMLCSAGTNKNTSPSPQEIAANALSGKDLLTLTELDLATRQETRRLIRAQMHEQKVRPDLPLTALINLGDTNAMQEAVELRGTPGSDIFGVRFLGKTLRRNCAQPRFLPFLTADLLIEEPATRRVVHGDVALERRSVDAARIMRGILTRSEAFSGEVRTWAEQLDVGNRGRIRSVMREWWQRNSVHVIQGEYSKTGPLKRK